MISLLLHLASLGWLDVRLPSFVSEMSTIQVSLIKVPAVAPPNTSAKVSDVSDTSPLKEEARVKPVLPKPKPSVEPLENAETVQSTEPIVSEPIVTEPLAPENVAATSAPEAIQQNTGAASPMEATKESDAKAEIQAAASSPSDAPSAAALPLPEAAKVPSDFEHMPPYRKVHMMYDVLRGPQTGRIGTAVIDFEAHVESGTYTLKSVMEPDFIAKLIVRGSLVQTSEGHLTEKGLQPAKYAYAFGENKDKQYVAEFDWPNASLTMKTAKGQKTVSVSPGAQDLLSFLVQFMYVPPLEEMQLAITNGRKFKEYRYQFVGEEWLELRAGHFRTIHIVNTSRDEQERTELWLAVDANHLPVKISKTEKDGAVTEQVLTDIATAFE